jgi:hypothetical protein
MARIRTIKPEFWNDEKLGPLDPLTRLVFLGLISMADDAGRLVDNLKQIDGFIFPDTDDTSRDSLDILARNSRIIRYTSASGQKLIQVAGWTKHQRVDNPNKYTLPAPSETFLATSSRDSRESFSTVSLNPSVTTNDQRPGIYDQGSSCPTPHAVGPTATSEMGSPSGSEVSKSPPLVAPPPPVDTEFGSVPCDGGADWSPPPDKVSEWHRAFTAVDVDTEIHRAMQWLRDNPGKRKTPRGMPRFIGAWLSRSLNAAPGRPTRADPTPLPIPPVVDDLDALQRKTRMRNQLATRLAADGTFPNSNLAAHHIRQLTDQQLEEAYADGRIPV